MFKTRKAIIAIVFLFQGIILFSNVPDSIHYNIWKTKFDKAYDLLMEYEYEDFESLYSEYEKEFDVYFQKYNTPLRLYYQHELVKLKGAYHFQKNEIRISAEYYEKAFDLLRETEFKDSTSNCIEFLQVLYKNLGRYEEALELLKVDYPEEFDPNYFDKYCILGNSLFKLGKTEEAERMYSYCEMSIDYFLDIQPKDTSNYHWANALYSQIIQYKLINDKLESALNTLDKFSRVPKVTELKSNFYRLQYLVSIESKNFNKAEKCLFLASNLLDVSTGNRVPDLIENKFDFIDLYLKSNQLQKSKKYFDYLKEFIFISEQEGLLSYVPYPNKEKNALEYLTKYITYLSRNNTPNKDEITLITYEVINLINDLRSDIRTSQDRIYSSQQYKSTFDKLLKINFDKAYFDNCKKIVSNAKYFGINYDRKKRSDISHSSSGDQILANLDSINQKIFALKTQLENNSKDGSQGIINELYNLRQSKKGLIDSITIAIDFTDEDYSFVDVPPNSSFIDYYQIDSTLYILHLKSDTFYIKQSSTQNIASLSYAIQKNETINHNILDSISNNILPLGDLEKSITVMPHGIINFVSFDILTINGEKLLNNYSISYNFQNYNSISKNKSIQNIAAVAPTFDQKCSTFEALTFNEKEISKLNQYCSNLKKYNNISSTQFIDLCKSNDIVHLASHTYLDLVNPKASFISLGEDCKDSFYNKVYIDNIVSNSFNNRLIVLSSCDSGNGKLYEGEGLASLARAFFSSNVDAILCTLWPVNDAATSFIMEHFYKHAKQGESLDIALQQAKIEFLETHGPEYAHPKYWAGFIIIGDTSPIQFENSNLKFILIGAAILGLIILIGFFLKRK